MMKRKNSHPWARPGDDTSASSNTPTNSDSQSDCTVHADFNIPGADITLQSSDGIQFKVHIGSLLSHSGGFYDAIATAMSVAAEPTSSSSVRLDLTETAEELALLLRYTQNQTLPDLRQYEFAVLLHLGEAAQKYKVFSAIAVCMYEMEKAATVQDHAKDVLAYACKYGYKHIADVAAPLTLSQPLSSMISLLPENGFKAWVQYREGYLKVMLNIVSGSSPVQHPGGFDSCTLWTEFHSNIVLRIKADSIRCQVEPIFALYLPNLAGCRHCIIRAGNWKRRVEMEVGGLPKLNHFW